MRLRVASLAILIATAGVQAQEAPRVLTAADYARAERSLSSNTSSLVFGGSVNPTWLEDGRFWYRNRFAQGEEIVVVDPSARTRARAFDHERLAAALTSVTDTVYTAFALPTRGLGLDAVAATFRIDSGVYACDLESYRCAEEPEEEFAATRTDVVSPDGSLAAFTRDHDLWVRDLETGEETRLTMDGVEDFGYATNNAGWTRSDRPVLKWSPDSRTPSPGTR
jgi:hypothetical protein